MAESDSILQLGIEAAREGNRDEARNLFRLLTRQDPSNAQGWLWLAGVAENRDERQAALERVIELDPTNEMAVKGLQAMGVRPTLRTNEEPSVAPPPAPQPVDEPTIPPPDDRSRYEEDDPFAELDTLSETMASSPSAVRRSETTTSEYDDLDDLSDAINADTAGSTRRGTTPRSTYDDDRETRRTTTTTVTYDDDESEPARRGPSPLLIGLVALGLLLLLGLLIWRFLLPGEGGIASGPGAEQTAAAQQGAPVLTDTVTLGPTEPAGGTDGGTTEPISPTSEIGAGGTITDTDVTSPTVEAPDGGTPPGPTDGAPDPAAAAPAVVPANTPLESNGWLYDFNQPTYAAPIVGGLGSFQPQGRFVVVLVFIANRSGTNQPIPANFFVLKDAQGRVYDALPEVSNAYVQRGINADLSQTDEIPADGLTRSVALIFDVAPDATDLVFFARSNPSQGWLVLSNVQ